MNIDQIILANLLKKDEYTKKVLAFLKTEYFSNFSHKIIFDKITEYYYKYNGLPTKSVLDLHADSIQINQSELNELKLEIENVCKYSCSETLKWLLDETEKFCKDKALYNAIHESIQIIDENSKNKKSKNMIPDILKQALSVSFDTNIGHSYFENSEDRYNMYHIKENKLPFDLELLNKITDGGLSSKTLNVVIAPPGGGKSIFLCHCACAYLRQHKNVLYITCEMSEEKIAERIDANLMDIDINDIKNIPKNIFDKKIDDLDKICKGKLIIKEYPTGLANVLHFKHLVEELKIKKNFIADVIIIDYINICNTVRNKDGSNSYSIVKSIAEEIRGFAVENDVPILSASQLNRCLEENTKVYIDGKGEIPIKDVLIGDKILSNNGYNTVLEKYENIQETYEIELESGHKILCSGNHIFPCNNSEMKSIDIGLKIGDTINTL